MNITILEELFYSTTGIDAELGHLCPPAQRKSLSEHKQFDEITSGLKSYFITINFSPKKGILYIPPKIGTSVKRFIEPRLKKLYKHEAIQYGDMLSDEQHKYLEFMIDRLYINGKVTTYHIFYEHCKDFRIHLHGRCYSELHLRDLHKTILRHFDINPKNDSFLCIKEYNKELWHDYEVKTSERKQHQKCHYPDSFELPKKEIIQATPIIQQGWLI